MTNPKTGGRRPGALGLLTAAAPAPVEEPTAEPAPEPTPGETQWLVADTSSGQVLAHVYATSDKTAVAAATEATGRAGGFTLTAIDPDTGQAAPEPTRTVGRPAALPAGLTKGRGAPAVLPRTRSKRIAKDKLTVQIPVTLLDALAVLVDRDSTRRYDEVEEALRKHLTAKGIRIARD